MTRTYSIIEVENINEYKDSILALWKRNLYYSSIERFKWLYEQNPLGKVFTWLAKHNETQQFVGFASVYPWNFNIKGRDIKVGVAIDFGVDEKHRVYGPALSLQKAIVSSMRKKGFDLVFVYPDKASSGVFQRAGYKYIGASNHWIKIIDCRYKLLKYIKVPLFAKILVSSLNKVLSLTELLLWRNNEREFVSETLGRCDERFDVLWEEEKFKYSLTPNKCASYLNWRYSDCKTSRYKYFCLFDKCKKHLKGFIIYGVKEGEIFIKDVFPAQSLVVLILLGRFLKKVTVEGASFVSLSYFGNHNFIDTIKRIGFFKRKIKRDYLLFFNEDIKPSIKDCLLNNENYYFFYG